MRTMFTTPGPASASTFTSERRELKGHRVAAKANNLQVLAPRQPPVPRTTVATLYARIVRDPRHADAVCIGFDPIPARRYGCWDMGVFNLEGRHGVGLPMEFIPPLRDLDRALDGRFQCRMQVLTAITDRKAA